MYNIQFNFWLYANVQGVTLNLFERNILLFSSIDLKGIKIFGTNFSWEQD